MNFELITVTTYGIIFLLWSSILYLYLSNIRVETIRHSSVAILLTILAIDAFRTAFESAYFGLYFSSLFEYLPPGLHQFLSQPGYLLIPKFVNMAAALVVLAWLLKVWIPKELRERELMKHEFEESSRLLELTRFSINHIADSLFWISPEGKILECNETACRKLGYTRQELLTMYVCEIDPEFPRNKWPAHWAELKKEKTLHFPTKHMTKEGRVIPVDIAANYVRHAEKEYNCAIVRDMTDISELDNIIWRQANYDELTNLPNRRLFNDRLNEATLYAHRNQSQLAIVFIDLDHFKDVNDTHGHKFGDQVLISVADKLNQQIRESDTLARFAGDEFAAILTDIQKPENIQPVLNRMLNSVIEPLNLGDSTIYLTASMGVTFYPCDAGNVESLLINADQAMYHAKANGRNQIHFFTPELKQNLDRRILLVSELREAIQNQQLELYYQPVINIKTNKAFKVEALLRWPHPERGLISPAEFIPLAEDHNLIVDLGDYVVEKVLNDLAKFKELDDDFIVAINTSPAHYKNQECIDSWLNKIEDAGFNGNDFIFEITERIMMPDTHNEVDKTLRKLNKVGIQTAIDDFGTGYSSLSYIKSFNIDIVKIDKSFVMNLNKDEHDQAICEAIVLMAHKLGMSIIAEGVETEEQLQFLKTIGCDYAQGYLFSKPNNLQEILALIQHRQN